MGENINVNDITLEQIGNKFVEWVDADRAYQKAREALWRDDFAEVRADYEWEHQEEFKTPRQPYREPQSTEDAVREMHDALNHQNKVYDELMLLTDLYKAKG